MTVFLRSIITTCIVLCVFACASQKLVEKKPQSNFQGMVLAQNVDSTGEIGVAKGQTSEFTTEDEQIVSLISFDNIYGSHKLRWEWVEPSGKSYLTTKDYPLDVKKGKYLPKMTAWHRISLKDEPAADIPGKWQVKLFVDDEMVESKPFFVKVSNDPLTLPKDFSVKPYPKDWGLIIGIENYKRLPKVDFARKDALTMRDYLVRVLGVPEKNIITLLDGDATKGRIEGYLKNYLRANVNKDSTLYVYFAGHGMPRLKEGDAKGPFLVPYDADIRFIEQTGYKLISFYEDLNELKLGRTFVFLDSCFSGMASRTDEMLAKNIRPALFHVEKVEPPNNSIISLNATSAGQISNAFPEKRHGLFTYYLLRALKGEADSNDDGWNSLEEIFSYVQNHVTRVSHRLLAEQTPSILPSMEKWKDVVISHSVE